MAATPCRANCPSPAERKKRYGSIDLYYRTKGNRCSSPASLPGHFGSCSGTVSELYRRPVSRGRQGARMGASICPGARRRRLQGDDLGLASRFRHLARVDGQDELQIIFVLVSKSRKIENYPAEKKEE